MADGTRFTELRERLARLEDFVGPPLTDSALAVSVQLERMATELMALRQSHEDHATLMKERWETVMADVCSVADACKDRMQVVEDEMTLVKRVLASGPARTGESMQKLKVPDPKPFVGERDSKELENFIWDMEQYFRAAHVPETELVTIAAMYLSGDAKLWWRTRSEDDARPRIVTWELLKIELRAQFLPTNAAWVARKNLKELQHTDTVREYVKQFSSLMLDIKNMSEEDRLFNFVSGLQPWAQTELRRQGVSDLAAAMAAADCLVDYKMDGANRNSKSGKFEARDKGKGKAYSEDKGERKDGERQANPSPSTQSSKGSNSSKGTYRSGCFICDGPHRARDCPKKESLNALTTEDQGESESEESVRIGSMRMNALQILESEELIEAAGKLELATPRTSSGFGGGGLLAP